MEAQNTNPRLAWLQQQIGQDMTNSPSPFAHWLKGTLLEVHEDGIKASYTVRKEMTNPVGMLHGGVIAGIFDDLLGTTFFSMNTEYFYPTVDLNVIYFASAREGEVVECATKVIKKGKTVIYTEATLHNAEGKLLAKAGSNIVKSSLKI